MLNKVATEENDEMGFISLEGQIGQNGEGETLATFTKKVVPVDAFTVYRPAIPSHVQVGPIRYRVERNFEAIHKAGASCRTPDLLGHIDHATQLISIAPGMGADQEADTLLHEVMHALIVNGGLSELSASDEGLVSGLATALLDCLRRNPEMVAFLTEAGR